MNCKHTSVSTDHENEFSTCNDCGATTEIGMGWAHRFLVYDVNTKGLFSGLHFEDNIIASTPEEAATTWFNLFKSKRGYAYEGSIQTVPYHNSVLCTTESVLVVKRVQKESAQPAG